MNRKENLLLLIDLQNDFCLPEGPLFVPGAIEDVGRISEFIYKNQFSIDHIVLTADSHQVMDISHPGFWVDRNGNHPEPFVQITSRDIQNGEWQAVLFKKEAEKYISDLEQHGEFVHTIWPEHCIAGSRGAAIADEVIQAVTKWAKRGNFYDLVMKGTFPLTEHFGALRANIPSPLASESQLNMKLVKKLMEYDRVIIAGEAKSHCVANTIKQITELTDFNRQLVILDDCMSNISGFEHIADDIFHKAGLFGAVVTTSEDYQLIPQQ